MTTWLEEVVVFLSECLKEKVFTEKTEAQLKALGDILNSSDLKAQIVSSTAANIASFTWETFYSAAQKVDSNLQVHLKSNDN